MSRVSEISPTLSHVYRNVGANADVALQLRELASRFKADLLAIDPTIEDVDIVHDMTLPNRPNGLVCLVVIQRKESQLVGRR